MRIGTRILRGGEEKDAHCRLSEHGLDVHRGRRFWCGICHRDEVGISPGLRLRVRCGFGRLQLGFGNFEYGSCSIRIVMRDAGEFRALGYRPAKPSARSPAIGSLNFWPW